jgi:hypothetical protein
MKLTSFQKILLFLPLTPLFMNGLCNRSDDDLLPPPDTDEYITYSFSGHTGSFTNPPGNIELFIIGGKTAFIGSSPTNGGQFYASFNGLTSGDYPVVDLSTFLDGNNYVQRGTPLQIKVTEYGGTGGYIIGSYSGTLHDSLSTGSYAVKGQFKIKNE